MINIPAIIRPKDPALIDRVIVQIQERLKEKLLWLNYSFGRAQRLVTKREGKDYFYPGAHIGFGEYQNLFPDDLLGNYSFFQIEDPQEVKFAPNSFNTIQVKYALIFWYNLNTIFEDKEDRNTEQVKAQILKVLTRELFLSSGRLNITSMSEKAENVFKGYSLKETESQLYMQPYAGLRIEGELFTIETC